jgi:hypothetical protein
MEFVACSVWNKRRRYDFDGSLLAKASSQRPHAARWAELWLYRLPPNAHANYVFSRIGYSRVYHQEQCPEVRHHLPFGHELPAPPMIAEIVACGTCAPARPASIAELDFLTTHRFEVTKHFAAICADADALVELLTERRRPVSAGQMAGLNASALSSAGQALPWLSEQLLSAAAAIDSALAAAYAVNLTPSSSSSASSSSAARSR